MAVTVHSSTFTGIEGLLTCVEVDITRGLPNFYMVGLADMSVKEAKERVRSALINSEFEFPVSKITVNLAPADIKKAGSHFDLPIAIGILAATGQIDPKTLEEYVIVGELSLSGKINRIKGALPIVMEGCRQKISKFIVPLDNAEECSIIREASIYPFTNLKEVIHFLKYKDLLPYRNEKETISDNSAVLDFCDVYGQESCKRALEVSAAGGHNVMLSGPPGSGKTMLAQRIPSILPELSYDEALEVTKIYSVSGNLDPETGLIKRRPFRDPHHTTTRIALIGGGTALIPGEITLSHNGVLFLDEILEFKKDILELLRQPLEDRYISISRISGNVRYPSNFMLVGALNPCPCGYYNSGVKSCNCSEQVRNRYLSKLSGPMLDRIDIFAFASPLRYKEMNPSVKAESSTDIRRRVEAARKLQKERFEKDNIYCNAQMNTAQIRKYCKIDRSTDSMIEKIFNRYSLSARAYSRILKVARTIADLDRREKINQGDVTEALQYRKFLNDNVL